MAFLASPCTPRHLPEVSVVNCALSHGLYSRYALIITGHRLVSDGCRGRSRNQRALPDSTELGLTADGVRSILNF
jgi:hypothetical protein